MIIVSKFYDRTGRIEHWMVVPNWCENYCRWNEIQLELARKSKGQIEPLLVIDETLWNSTYHNIGFTISVIKR